MIGSTYSGQQGARAYQRLPLFVSTILLVLLASHSVDLLAQAREAGQQTGSLTGIVIDPFGSRVPRARVTLATDQGVGAADTTTADGSFTFTALAPGLYQIAVMADGFEPFSSMPVYVARGERTTLEATLRIGPLEQAVVVTAAAQDIPQSQTGAPITVIDARTLEISRAPTVLDALRAVPGTSVSQTGVRGGTASLFVRGGAGNFNKVLVDDVPVNDIGGAFDFAQLSTTGIDRIEVLRQTNSVMYGTDALAGVIAMTTRRGQTRRPEITYSADGGNLGTVATDGGIGGIVKRFDYFSEYSYFRTDNDLPNNRFRNGTYAGRFGVALGSRTDVSGTIRRADTRYGSPGAFDLYGIADDSSQKNEVTYASVSTRSQITNRWQTAVRFGISDQTLRYVNPAPTGEPFDPFGFGANYLGRPVTLRDATGATVSGRPILDFGGTYPSRFASRSTRRLVAGDTSYRVASSFSVSAGARYEREQAFGDPAGDATETRNNGGAFVEGRWTLRQRHYVTAGLGIEHNTVFGEVATPRLSIASYLRRRQTGGVTDTKLVFNAGTGIKAPSVFQAQSSLFELVKNTSTADGIEPIGPERSRSVDVGVEQGMAGGLARARIAYFRNSFRDLIEFLSPSALVRAGVPGAVANASGFGAYINAQSYRAQGLEASIESAPVRELRVTASYTYLDAEVTRAFSASASMNPVFPGVAIGAFSPLVGARPFRRPTHSGSVVVLVTPRRTEIALSASLVGKRDDSTFLTDQFFGNSLLLPNHDLAAAYQKIDLSAAYVFHPRLRGYMRIDNLFDRDYEEAFGYPALPLTARVGVRLVLGGSGSIH